MNARTTCWAIRMIAMAVALTAVTLPTKAAEPLGTSFAYKGQLKLGGVPLNDTCDFEFRLWNNAIGTLPSYEVGPTLMFDGQDGNPPPITVTSGLFAADLDFGADSFGGFPKVLDQRWLEIQVACPSGGALQPLSPRQPIRATPYALQTRGLFVDEDRNVGIGTTTPTNRLSLYGNMNLMGYLGIGEEAPSAKLHIGGTAGVDGIMFPDGTLQTTAAAEGGGSLWTLDQPGRISYDGEVTIGTDNTTANLKVFTEEGPAITALVAGEVGDGIVVSTVGVGSRAIAATASGEESYALDATATNTEGIAAYIVARGTNGTGIWALSSGANGVTIKANARTDTQVAIEANATGTATLNDYPLPNTAGKFYASGADGVGIFARTDGSSSYGVHGKAEGSTGRGVYGEATLGSGTGRGVYGEATLGSGTGLYGYNSSSTGSAIAVRGHTNSSSGFSGYFTGGKNYFAGRVGLGKLTPEAKLHIGGTPGSDGIMFPDGTLQTTAAVGGGGDSLWTASGSDIFYTAGKVGIGTSAPQGKLHLAGANANLLMFENGGSPFLALGDDTTTVGWLQWSSPNDELDLYTYGHNYPIAIGPTSSGGVFVDTVANNGNVGIGTTAPSESLHVAGDSRFDGSIGIGIAPGTFSPLQINTDTLVGMKASTTFPIAGAGIWGESTADNGETRGVYGTAASPDGVGVYGESAGTGVEGIGGTYGVRGEADGAVEFSFGVSGRASTEAGRGVTAYNSATEGSAIGVYGATNSSEGFGGFFMGNGYFRDALSIGGSWEPTNKLTVRDDPFHTFDILSSMGVRDHTALIENEHTPGLFQTTGVLALRANSPVGGNVNYITFFQRNAQTLVSEPVGSIEGDGSGGIVLESLGGDYAEWLPVVDCEETFEPGDIVGVVGGRITKNTEGAHHVMLISTAPIVLGNQPPDGSDEDQGYQKVAFIGQAPVKVRGPIDEGDFIIPSGLQDGTGIGVSPESITSEQFAQVIGQAWESSDESGLNRVLAVIGQLPPDPTVARMADRIAELENETETLRGEAASLRTRLESLEAIVTKLAGGGNGGK